MIRAVTSPTKGTHYWTDNGAVCGTRFILEDGPLSFQNNLASVTCTDCVAVIMDVATNILIEGTKQNGHS